MISAREKERERESVCVHERERERGDRITLHNLLKGSGFRVWGLGFRAEGSG